MSDDELLVHAEHLLNSTTSAGKIKNLIKSLSYECAGTIVREVLRDSSFIHAQFLLFIRNRAIRTVVEIVILFKLYPNTPIQTYKLIIV